jgi:hypothetical protein
MSKHIYEPAPETAWKRITTRAALERMASKSGEQQRREAWEALQAEPPRKPEPEIVKRLD